MRKYVFLIFLCCIVLTACAEIPEPVKNPGMDYSTPTPTEKVFGPNEKRDHRLGRVVYVGEEYYAVHIVTDAAYYMLVEKALTDAELNDDLRIEYVGTVLWVDETIKHHDIPAEYMELISENGGKYLVPEKIEKAEVTENDGIARGIVFSPPGLLPEGKTYDEKPENPYSIRLDAEEDEGEISLDVWYSRTEIVGKFELGAEVILYYDVDTFAVYRVEAAE